MLMCRLKMWGWLKVSSNLLGKNICIVKQNETTLLVAEHLNLTPQLIHCTHKKCAKYISNQKKISGLLW